MHKKEYILGGFRSFLFSFYSESSGLEFFCIVRVLRSYYYHYYSYYSCQGTRKWVIREVHIAIIFIFCIEAGCMGGGSG